MKDVKYKDGEWQSLSEGIIQLTSAGLFEWLEQADKISGQAETACNTYDVDRAITIDTAKNSNYSDLETRLTPLQQAIQKVPDTLTSSVDYPFYDAMDTVVEKLSNMNIMAYETSARGIFYNGTSNANSPMYKSKVTLGDLLGTSSPLTDYLKVEYNQMKQEIGEVSFEDYKNMAFADTSFDYYSKSEKITDLAVTLIIGGATVYIGGLLPTAIMTALGYTAAGVNGYAAYTGKDLLTGKELSDGDRILRGLSAIADTAMALYGTVKIIQGNRYSASKIILDNGDSAYIAKDGTLVRSKKFLDKNGEIKWPEKGDGFVLDANGNPITVKANLKVGDIIDRYGDPSGTFSSPYDAKNPIKYDQRGMPYPESTMDYHQYKIVKEITPENIQKGFDNLSIDDKGALESLMNDYGFNLNSMGNPLQGEIAPVFGSGGGQQIKFSTSIEWYEKLGLIKEI